MAITKILARNNRLDQAIQYVLNGEKTDDHILTAHQNCDPGWEYQQMMETKRAVGKQGGRQCYHLIQSFRPGEITPELALEIAKEFAAEYLADYEVVIGTHTDRGHIHSHLIFNSVNARTGEKYHITTQEYYRQIRAVSDRLCREHGLSVIVEGEPSRAVSYIEWLRESRGQPTFRSMLGEDLRAAIGEANDLGHFFLIMEHKGYEIRHGARLGFRLRGQPRFQYPGRRDARYTEDGIRAAIRGNLGEIEAGRRPVIPPRPAYRPFPKHPGYTGFLALYVHYLHLLGKAGQERRPPRMTARLRREAMKAERYRAEFVFLRDNGISTPEEMAAFSARTEEALAGQIKRRILLHVRKKRRKALYDALADAEALAPARALYEEGLSGMEGEYTRWMEAEELLKRSGIPRERLLAEKGELYNELAEINRRIRAERKKLAMCREIQDRLPRMEREVEQAEGRRLDMRETDMSR